MFPPMNFVWDRDPEEAYQNPYEYRAQQQFHREARSLLAQIHSSLLKSNEKYTIDDRSVNKAVWMLSNDSCEGLLDALELLKKKKHGTVGRILRDVVETTNLASYFLSRTTKSTKALEKWYDNEIIENSKYRFHVSDSIGKEYAQDLWDRYKLFSKFTHRTYRTLAFSYVRGGNGIMVHENAFGTLPAVPFTISMYYAILGYLIKLFAIQLKAWKIIPELDLETILTTSIEKNPVKRRFATREEARAMKMEMSLKRQHKP